MRYTHVDLSQLCQNLNEKLSSSNDNQIEFFVWANGGTTSIWIKNLFDNSKKPLLEDVSRDEGFRFLQGYIEAILGSRC